MLTVYGFLSGVILLWILYVVTQDNITYLVNHHDIEIQRTSRRQYYAQLNRFKGIRVGLIVLMTYTSFEILRLLMIFTKG